MNRVAYCVYLAILLSLVLIMSVASIAEAQAPGSGGGSTGVGEGIEIGIFPCGPVGEVLAGSSVDHSSETCDATGSRTTATIHKEWLLGGRSTEAIYPGVHGARVLQRVKYGDKEYWQSAGWYTDEFTKYSIINPPLITNKRQAMRQFCYVVGPDGEGYWSGNRILVPVISPNSKKLAVLLRLNQASACDRDPACGGYSSGRQDWVWECRFGSADDGIIPSVAKSIAFTVTSSAQPEIVELRHGFITHDMRHDNDARTTNDKNSHFIPPAQKAGKFYNIDTAEVFWGKDGINQVDGQAVKIESHDAWKWTTCMGVPGATVQKPPFWS